jgi:iron complex outermembrane receptor protein
LLYFHILNISYRNFLHRLMRILVGCLLLMFLAGVGSYTYAQSGPAVIQGRVLIEDNLPAEAATVILVAAADSSILKSTICNVDGEYSFSVLPGKYLILASRIGYEQFFSGPYIITEDKDIHTRDITLIKSLPELKEVSISARRSYVEVQAGKVVLNVQNSIVAEGNSAFDVLRQAPGVHVGNQGNVSIIGRQNALVMIDNKPIGLSGDNLVSYLQSMQSSSIQRIELITNPSAKYEAAGAGVINIISKKGTNVGTNGTLTGGAGYGKFYKANIGVTFNNRMGDMNIFGNYNYSANKTFHTFTTDRHIIYKGLASDYDVDYYTTRESYNHTFRLGTDFFLSPQHTLGFLVSGTVNNNDFMKDNSLKIANRSVLDSTIVTTSKLNRDLSNINYDINYNGKLDTAGQVLSVDLSYNNYDRHSDEYISNHFYNSSGSAYRPPLYQQNISPSDIRIWASKIDYVKPLSKTAQLEAGVKYSWIKSNNVLVFGPKVNNAYTVDPKLSSDFVYKENINSAYANYTNKIGKVNIVAGLRVEQTNSKGDSTQTLLRIKKNYLDLFPQAQLRYSPNAKNDFAISFNRSIQRPVYEDINPFLYYVDLYDYRSGNPNLLPEYSNKIELSHTYNKTIVTSLYATVTTNIYDFNVLLQNDSSKVNITTRKNFGDIYIYGLRFFTPLQFTSWWTGNISLDASYQRIKAYKENGNLDKGTQDILLSSLQSFRIASTWAAEISGKYESPTFYGFSQFKANYRVDAGISKQVFDKKGTLRLSVTDIFRTERDRAYSNYQNLNVSIINRDEGRIVRFGFTYRFGKISLKSSTRHNAGNEDEQKRAGGVAGSAN